ncbi:unnamed protein product [Prunus armeniaca]
MQPHTASMKIELKLFTSKENFMLGRMKYALAQLGLNVVLAGKEKMSKIMTAEEWNNLDEWGPLRTSS